MISTNKIQKHRKTWLLIFFTMFSKYTKFWIIISYSFTISTKEIQNTHCSGDFGDDFSFEFKFCFDLELLVNPKLGITAHFKVVPTSLSEMCFTSKNHFHYFCLDPLILKGRVPG